MSGLCDTALAWLRSSYLLDVLEGLNGTMAVKIFLSPVAFIKFCFDFVLYMKFLELLRVALLTSLLKDSVLAAVVSISYLLSTVATLLKQKF